MGKSLPNHALATGLARRVDFQNPPDRVSVSRVGDVKG